MAARSSLLAALQSDHVDQSLDEENVLDQIASMTLGDQNRVGAIMEHQAVTDWLLNSRFGALLVNGNGRRQDALSSTSVACALLIHVFSKKLQFPTLYWYCGLHCSGPRGNPLGMLKNLICQLLSLPCCVYSMDDQNGLDTQHFGELLKLFLKLLRRSSSVAPIVCILDGISFYEGRHQRADTSYFVGKLASLAKSEPPVLLFFLTSPMTTAYITRQPEIVQNLTIAEVPYHVSGAKQGIDSRHIMSSTERRVRSMSESLESRT